MTDHEAVSEDVNSYYLKTTLPYDDRTTEECLFCDKSWGKVVTTNLRTQLRKYKDKAGDFSQPDVQEAAKVTLPSKLWEN